MPKVILDLATMQFVPVNYTRTPAGSEGVGSLAAHLRGVDGAFAAQAGVNAGFAAAADQSNQYADIGIDPGDGPIPTTVDPADTRTMSILPVSQAFINQRKWAGTAFNWGQTDTAVLFPDAGLWGIGVELSVAGSASGTLWTITPAVGGVPITAARQQFRTTAIGDPIPLTLLVRGRVLSLTPDTSRAFSLLLSHDQAGQRTLSVVTAFYGFNWRDA